MKTPFFKFNKSILDNNIRKFQKFNSEDIDVFFALKANNYSTIVVKFIKSGFGFDVASAEEISLCIMHGAKPEKISFSAPSKFFDDIKYSIKKGVPYYAFDSIGEAEKILKVSNNVSLFARISTSNRRAAFNLSEKFGFSEEYFHQVLKKAKVEKWPLKGISFHIGSQNLDDKAWDQGLLTALKFIKLASRYGININQLNIGGGIPAQYSSEVNDLDYYIDLLINKIKSLRKKHYFEKIIIEPGRALVANTMQLHTTILDIKEYKEPKLLIVDTSVFGGVIEALEHFEYPVSATKKGTNLTPYRIGGYSCDSYDIIKQEVYLPSDLKIGDRLIIEQAGAYTSVFNEFQMKPFPKIY